MQPRSYCRAWKWGCFVRIQSHLPENASVDAMPSHPLCRMCFGPSCTGMTEKWGLYSLITRSPPFFVLRFAFSIIRGSRFRVLYKRKPKNKNGGGLVTRLGIVSHARNAVRWLSLPHMLCASGLNPATHKNSSKSMMQIWWKSATWPISPLHVYV